MILDGKRYCDECKKHIPHPDDCEGDLEESMIYPLLSNYSVYDKEVCSQCYDEYFLQNYIDRWVIEEESD